MNLKRVKKNVLLDLNFLAQIKLIHNKSKVNKIMRKNKKVLQILMMLSKIKIRIIKQKQNSKKKEIKFQKKKKI